MHKSQHAWRANYYIILKTIIAFRATNPQQKVQPSVNLSLTRITSLRKDLKLCVLCMSISEYLVDGGRWGNYNTMILSRIHSLK